VDNATENYKALLVDRIVEKNPLKFKYFSEDLVSIANSVVNLNLMGDE
jgi:hypothetical protein